MTTVGVCSRCATAVILTPLVGATCTCGATRIPWDFFAQRPACSTC